MPLYPNRVLVKVLLAEDRSYASAEGTLGIFDRFVRTKGSPNSHGEFSAVGPGSTTTEDPSEDGYDEGCAYNADNNLAHVISPRRLTPRSQLGCRE
jgi:hypothetical protein